MQISYVRVLGTGDVRIWFHIAPSWPAGPRFLVPSHAKLSVLLGIPIWFIFGAGIGTIGAKSWRQATALEDAWCPHLANFWYRFDPNVPWPGVLLAPSWHNRALGMLVSIPTGLFFSVRRGGGPEDCSSRAVSREGPALYRKALAAICKIWKPQS